MKINVKYHHLVRDRVASSQNIQSMKALVIDPCLSESDDKFNISQFSGIASQAIRAKFHMKYRSILAVQHRQKVSFFCFVF